MGNVTLNAHLSAELGGGGGDARRRGGEKFRYANAIANPCARSTARIRDVETRFRVADEDEDEDEAKRASPSTTAAMTADGEGDRRASRLARRVDDRRGGCALRRTYRSAVRDSDAKLLEKTVALGQGERVTCRSRALGTSRFGAIQSVPGTGGSSDGSKSPRDTV